MDKIGKQILFYLTLGGCGIWTLYRLFTLNGAIKEYNKKIAARSRYGQPRNGCYGIILTYIIFVGKNYNVFFFESFDEIIFNLNSKIISLSSTNSL
jgi:hypothetical protein